LSFWAKRRTCFSLRCSAHEAIAFRRGYI